MGKIDTRKSKRINIIILADVSSTLYNVSGRGCIVDLSTGGMGIETTDDLGKADYVNIRFALPNGTVFNNIRGIIVRRSKNGPTYSYGIRFTDISLMDKFRIFKFTRKL